ncbi:PilN domain-containing protein [Hoeflea sp. TYP-13]|uniref:PilN domain-containing protein n=1 Tax=Hoeflea sp. TYP-13 TaxID=3230023 RepID=UPI0034C636F3
MSSATATITDFRGWFADELAGMLRSFVGKTEPTELITIVLGGSGQLFPAELHLKNKQKQVLVDSIDDLEEAIEELTGRMRLACQIALSNGHFIQRQIAGIRLPRSRAQSMAEVDVGANTPFQMENIHVLLPSGRDSPDRTTFFLVKRSEIDPVIRAVQKCGCSVDSVLFRQDDDIYHIDKISVTNLAGVCLSVRITRWLLAASLLVLIAGLAGTYAIADYKFKKADSVLNAQITAAQKEAGAARRKYESQVKLLERMSSLRQEKNATGATVAIWEQLSHILPDNTWLSDFTIENGTITLSGYSTSAAAIIPLLERSGKFADPRFTASVNRVPGQDFERFTLQTSFIHSGAES